MTDIKLPPLPEHFAHQSERVQEHVRGYAREAVRMNRCESRASTHAEGCWNWGPAHYECAVGEIKRLAAALEAAQMGLRYAVRVWVLSDEIVWSEEEIDEVVESIIGDAKKEAGND